MTARHAAILGLDLGTTEVKAGLVTLDGRLLALARSGYGLDASGGHGWAEQDPGAWWSAVVSAVRALRAADLADIVAIGVDGHGPTLVAVDARGEATRPAITFLDSRATAEAAELEAATGVRGWSLGGLPAALWVERHEPAVAAADALVPLDLGVAGVPADRASPTARSSRTRSIADPAAVAAAGVPARPAAAALGDGERRRRPDRDRGRCARPATRDPGRRAAPSTPSRATSAPASSSPATPTTRAARRAASGSTGIEPVSVPGGFVTPAPLAGRYSVGAAMAATGRALDWYRDDVLGGTISDRIAPRRGRRDAARRRRPRLPAVPRRRALADLGPGGARRARRPDPRPRPRPHRAGDRRGLGARHPPRRGADARGGRPGHGDARLRRPGAEPLLERGQGRRDRLHGRSSRRSSRPPSSARRSWRRSASAPIRTSPTAIRAMTRITERIEPRPELAPTSTTGSSRHTSALYPATAPLLRPLSADAATTAWRPARDRQHPPRGPVLRLPDPRRRRAPGPRRHRPRRSRAAGSSPSSARTAAASRRSCASSPACSRPASGAAQLDGSPIDGPDPRIGLVFQEPRLLPWRSAADNITYPLELAGWPPSAEPPRVGDADRARRPRPGGRATRARPSCPAGRASASRSPGRWRSSPRCSCSTSRSARSMRSAANASTSSCCGSGSARRRRSSWSPTASPRRSWSPTGSSSCRRGPGRVVADIPVDLPRPRTIADLDEPAVVRTAREIRAHLGDPDAPGTDRRGRDRPDRRVRAPELAS